MAVAIIGKIVGCLVSIRISSFTKAESTVVGIAMGPRAGVELVFIRIGMDAGVFKLAIVSSLLLMVIVTTLMTPPALSYAFRKFGLVGQRQTSDVVPMSPN